MDPHLDRPPTRHLERLEVDRLRLSRTTIRQTGEAFVVLDGHLVGTVGGGESNLMGAWDSFPTGICRTPVERRRLATEVFSIRDDECVDGFGEQFGRLDKVGRTIDVNMEEAMGTVTPRAYESVPFWFTTAGWGVFANHDARLTAWIGRPNVPPDWSFGFLPVPAEPVGVEVQRVRSDASEEVRRRP